MAIGMKLQLHGAVSNAFAAEDPAQNQQRSVSKAHIAHSLGFLL